MSGGQQGSGHRMGRGVKTNCPPDVFAESELTSPDLEEMELGGPLQNTNKGMGVSSQMRVPEPPPSSMHVPAASTCFKAGFHLYTHTLQKT